MTWEQLWRKEAEKNKALKARDARRLKWVAEKEKELILLNYPYGSNSNELKLIREVKALLLLEEEAKTKNE